MGVGFYKRIDLEKWDSGVEPCLFTHTKKNLDKPTDISYKRAKEKTMTPEEAASILENPDDYDDKDYCYAWDMAIETLHRVGELEARVKELEEALENERNRDECHM